MPVLTRRSEDPERAPEAQAAPAVHIGGPFHLVRGCSGAPYKAFGKPKSQFDRHSLLLESLMGTLPPVSIVQLWVWSLAGI